MTVCETFQKVSITSYPLTVAPKESWAYEPIKKGQRWWQIGFNETKDEVVTEYGALGGKVVLATRKVKPSRGKSVSEQALVEINSRMKIKITKDGFSLHDGDCVQKAEERTTEASVRPFPMLANELGSKMMNESDFPAFVQPKIDGVRCMMDFSENGLRMTSRGRNDFGHLKELFISDAETTLSHLPYGTVLDGELVVIEGPIFDFQRTTAAVRTSKSLTDDARTFLKYALFGIYVPSDPTLTFGIRKDMLEAAFTRVKRPERMFLVETRVVANRDEIMSAHKEYVFRGYEGVMVYTRNGVYAPGKRTNSLLKYKSFDELEGVVMSVVGGEGKETDAAKVEIKCPNGVTIFMRPQATLEVRRMWLETPSLVVGKKMTFTCQGFTRDGVPRFAVARDIRDYE